MVGVIVITLAAGAAAFACLNDRGSYTGFLIAPSISGAERGSEGGRYPALTTDQARRQSSLAIATLPNVMFEEPCRSNLSPITLLEVTANENQVLLSYSHAVWLRLTRPSPRPSGGLGLYAMPRKIEVGKVRGRRAEITAHGWKRSYFFCGSGFDCSAILYDSVNAQRWHPLGAELHWVENGVDIRLQGPYRASELALLATKLEFETS